MPMRPFLSALAALLVSAWITTTVPAQTTVATDPVGFTTFACPANSDTFVSVPFVRIPEFVGAVAASLET